MTSNSRRLWKK